MTSAKTLTEEGSELEDILGKHSPQFVVIEPGEVISGRVIAKDRGKILVDIGGVATGIISGRELTDTFQTAKGLKVGDEISAFVLEAETDEGMVILSLRKAAQNKAWEYFQKIKNEGGTLEVTAKEANKGGLMVEVSGVTAFLPVSQLAPEHYPRVDGADAQLILEKLGKLISQKFTCKIILLDQEIQKLVVSEREATAATRENEMSKLKIGDVVDGEVNGLVKFGAFMIFGNLEGLIHISELTWSHVKNPTELFKMGDKIKAQVIGIEGNKISLSIKRLQPDPWVDKVKSYPVNSVHPAVINKVTNFGVFVTLEEDVNGLVHTSEFESEKANPETTYREGQEVTVKILEVLMDDHSLKLSFKGLEEKKQKAVAKSETKKEAEKESKDEPEEEKETVQEEAAKPAPKSDTEKQEVKKKAAKKTTAAKKPAKATTKKTTKAGEKKTAAKKKGK